MSIRNAAKAIILHQNKILLNKCHNAVVGDYYTLPGGGQNQYETMEEAVVRECLEETGYVVMPNAFVALYEEIYTHPSVRDRHPDYAHKIDHIFRCSLADRAVTAPSEQDSEQLGCVWVDIDNLASLVFLPAGIQKNIQALIHSPVPLYLGSDFIDMQANG